jgi:hypothetical protein
MKAATFADMVLMVDVFNTCIEAGIMPAVGSPCHRLARKLVEQSGMMPKRKRRRLPGKGSMKKEPKLTVTELRFIRRHIAGCDIKGKCSVCRGIAKLLAVYFDGSFKRR